MAASFLTFMVCGALWLFQLQASEIAQHETAEFVIQNRARLQPTYAPPVAPKAHGLPPFSSADLTAQFHATASDIDLNLDEVLFALDAGNNQPYLRYRVTLSVKTGYPQIRRFVAALAADLPHASLDNVRCNREEASIEMLSCDLVFSAFFQKSAHG